MDDKERLAAYARLFAQIARPVRDIPFSAVIRGLSGREIIPFDPEANPADKALLVPLKKAFASCVAQMRKVGIASSRPNEAGNYAEPFVADSLREARFMVEAPRGSSGKKKTTGYPDLLFYDRDGIPTYLEIKTYNRENKHTTQRSFYVSPSEDFKVTMDARHLVLGFELEDVGTAIRKGKTVRLYKPNAYSLVSVEKLRCQLKYEFNAANRQLYADGEILLEGRADSDDSPATLL